MKNNKIVKAITGLIIVLLGALIYDTATEFIGEKLNLSGGWDTLVYIFFLILLYITIEVYRDNRTNVDKKQQSIVDKQVLLDNLKEQYINRLNSKMKNHLNLDIDLKLYYTTEGTSDMFVDENFLITEESCSFEKAYRYYENKIRRLLIIGEPGTGKSILLLKFALRLIEKSLEDENYPIPLIIELSTWNNQYNSIEDWLSSAIKYSNTAFSISKSRVKDLIDKKELIFLFDGFDEMDQKYRDSFLKKLDTFVNQLRNNRANFYPEIIITSRINEYRISTDAPVFATLKIEDISKEQVIKILKKRGKIGDPKSKNLKKKMKQHPILYDICNSAFFLYLLLSVDLKLVNLKLQNIDKLKEEILNEYINYSLSKLNKYSYEYSIRSLSWFSYYTKYKNNSKSFELINLQSSWVPNVKLYYLISSILLGFSFFVLFSSMIFFIYPFFWSLFICLLVFVCATTTSYSISIISDWLVRKIEKNERKSSFTKYLLNQIKLNSRILYNEKSSYKFRDFDKKKFINRLKIFIPLSILFSIITFFVDNLSLKEGFSFSFFYTLFMIFIVGITNFNTKKNISKTTSFYQRVISQEGKIFSIMFVIFTLFFGFIYLERFDNLSGFLIIGPIVSIIMVFSIGAIGKYFSLFLVLKIKKITSFDFFFFLGKIAKHTDLINKDGGKFKFRHQIILDHLAKKYKQLFKI